jgi:hypothetical protein
LSTTVSQTRSSGADSAMTLVKSIDVVGVKVVQVRNRCHDISSLLMAPSTTCVAL